MNKLIIAALTATGMLAGTPALAQAAGAGTSPNPETYVNPVTGESITYHGPHVPPRMPVPIAGVGARQAAYPYFPYASSILGLNGLPYASAITSWDRDGDGVSNRRDRFPDDPRYR